MTITEAYMSKLHLKSHFEHYISWIGLSSFGREVAASLAQYDM